MIYSALPSVPAESRGHKADRDGWSRPAVLERMRARHDAWFRRDGRNGCGDGTLADAAPRAHGSREMRSRLALNSMVQAFQVVAGGLPAPAEVPGPEVPITAVDDQTEIPRMSTVPADL